MSGITDGLQDFLKTWCDDSVVPEDVATMLHSSEGAQYTGWLEDELRDAYVKGIFTPEFLSMNCNRHFDDAQGVIGWLQTIWPLWFDEPFTTQSLPPVNENTVGVEQYQEEVTPQGTPQAYQQAVQQITQVPPQYGQPVEPQTVQPQQYQQPQYGQPTTAQPQATDTQQPPQQPGQPGTPQGY